MAAESLLGTHVVNIPSQAAKVLIDKFLSDSNPASLKQGDAGNGASVIVYSGGNGDVNIAITPPGRATAGSLSEGPGKSLEFQLPADTGLVSKNIDADDAATAQDYVKGIVDKYLPDNAANPAAAVQKAAIIDALARALDLAGTGSAINVTIRNIDFFTGNTSANQPDSGQQALAVLDASGAYQGADSLVGADDVLLDAGSSEGNQLFVVNLAGLADRTLVLQNVDAAVLAAGGTVSVAGSTPIRITSDSMAQNITGGGGADTLIGTGNDTLAGGAGADVFGFTGVGHYVISDFDTAGDALVFDVAGIGNLGELKARVTSVVATSTGISYNFGPDASVTLVGLSVDDLTAGMIKFTL